MSEALRHVIGLIKSLEKLFPGFERKVIENLRS